MPAFLVVTMSVHDGSWREEYRANVPAILAKFGGEYLVATPNVEVIEGDATPPDTAAVLKFPDMASLKGFIEADEYRPYRDARLAGADCVMYGLDA